MVRSYVIDQTNGSISAVAGGGGPQATGMQPVAIALAPDRTTLFVANSGDNTVSVYPVNPDGSLASQGTPVAAGNTPMAMAVDSTHNLLFVADQASDSIMVFSITPVSTSQTSDTLILKSSFPIQTPAATGGNGPAALAITPLSFSCIDHRTPTPVFQQCLALYAANQITGTVTAYDYFVDKSGNFVRGSIDPSGNFIVGGTVAGSPYTTGTNPSALAFSYCAGVSASSGVTSCQAADANSLFVANSGSNDLTVFLVCVQVPCQSGESSPDGTLTQTGSLGVTGSGLTAVLASPNSNFVYAVESGSNQISEYHYDTASGALSVLGMASLTGTSTSSGGITPNVSNGLNSANWIVLTSPGALSTLRVGSDGRLTALSSGPYSIQGQPSAILIK
jgi:6-phosphogluconolactonase (cycloisomerase 2 family)